MGAPIVTPETLEPTVGRRPRVSARWRHPVLTFLGRRVGAGVLTLLVASMLVFAMTELLPGDVASVVLGRNATPTAVAELQDKLGLDRSFVARYGDWLGGIVTGDLGESTVGLAQGAEHPSVSAKIGEPIRNSAILAGIAFVLFVPLALLLGVFAGVRAGRPADYTISLTALALSALPEFVIAHVPDRHLLQLPRLVPARRGVRARAVAARLRRQPGAAGAHAAGGGDRHRRAHDPRRRGGGDAPGLRDDGRAERLPAPAHRLALRGAQLDGAERHRHRAGRARTWSAGIIITENVFNYPGVGRLLVDAVKTRDVSVVQAVAMILATIYVVLNILADLLVVFLIPKLRTGGR